MSRKDGSQEESQLLFASDEDAVRPAAGANGALTLPSDDPTKQKASVHDDSDGDDDLEVYGNGILNGSSLSFPPAAAALAKQPRFVEESRSHAYDADDGVLDGELDDSDVPVLQGLLANARTRGSIDATRSSAAIEDPEHGLVVGRGSATLLSSIA